MWSYTFVLVGEHFLMQEANLECMRRYSAYPEVALPLMMTFQVAPPLSHELPPSPNHLAPVLPSCDDDAWRRLLHSSSPLS